MLGRAREYGTGPRPVAILTRLRFGLSRRRAHLLLRAPIAVRAPVHILHGVKDADIPYGRSLMLAEKLESERVLVEFSKWGDHRLSTAEDLGRHVCAVEAMAGDRVGYKRL